MNYIVISPGFPKNFTPFTKALSKQGVTVLGIGEAPYESLDPSLKETLTEYYRVDAMDDYDQMLRACAFFTHKYGKIDRIESHHERWLETDARLRTDFNVQGLKVEDMARIKRKSGMKKTFKKAGLLVAPGAVVHTLDDALKFVKRNKYPVVIKHESVSGTSDARKINNREELEAFLTENGTEYFIEAFIKGSIHSFDGLTDQEGNIVFYSSMVYGDGILETMAGDFERTFHIPRKLNKKVVECGTNAVHAFHLKERFFHLELFVTPDDEIYALDLNARPPGGWMIDMFNYANDFDIFEQYAKIVTKNVFDAEVSRPYNCYYVGRRHKYLYVRSKEEILSAYPDEVIFQSEIDPSFSTIIGDHGFIFRTPDPDRGLEIEQVILAKAADSH